MKIFISEYYIYWGEVFNYVTVSNNFDFFNVVFLSENSYFLDNYEVGKTALLSMQKEQPFYYKSGTSWFWYELTKFRGIKYIRYYFFKWWMCTRHIYLLRADTIYDLKGTIHFYDYYFGLNNIFNPFGSMNFLNDCLFFNKGSWFYTHIGVEWWRRYTRMVFGHVDYTTALSFPSFPYMRYYSQWIRNFVFCTESMHSHFWIVLQHFMWLGFFFVDDNRIYICDLYDCSREYYFSSGLPVKTLWLSHFFFILLGIVEYSLGYVVMFFKFFLNTILVYDFLFLNFFFSNIYIYIFFRFYSFIVGFYETIYITLGFIRMYKWDVKIKHGRLKEFFYIKKKDYDFEVENVIDYKNNEFFSRFLQYKFLDFCFVYLYRYLLKNRVLLFFLIESFVTKVSFFFRLDFFNSYISMKNLRIVLFFFNFSLLIIFVFFPLLIVYWFFIYLFKYTKIFVYFLEDSFLNSISVFFAMSVYFEHKYHEYFKSFDFIDKSVVFFYINSTNIYTIYRSLFKKEYKQKMYDEYWDNVEYQKSLYLLKPIQLLDREYLYKKFLINFDIIVEGLNFRLFLKDIYTKIHGISDKSIVSGIHELYEPFLAGFVKLDLRKFRSFYFCYVILTFLYKLFNIICFSTQKLSFVSLFIVYYMYYWFIFFFYMGLLFFNFVGSILTVFSNKAVFLCKMYFIYVLVKRILLSYEVVRFFCTLIVDFMVFLRSFYIIVKTFISKMILLLKKFNEFVDTIFFNPKSQIFILPLSKLFILFYFYLVRYNVVFRLVCFIFWKIWLFILFCFVFFVFFDFSFIFNFFYDVVVVWKLDVKFIFYCKLFYSFFIKFLDFDYSSIDFVKRVFLVNFLYDYPYNRKDCFLFSKLLSYNFEFLGQILEDYERYKSPLVRQPFFNLDLGFLFKIFGLEYRWFTYQYIWFTMSLFEYAEMIRISAWFYYYPNLIVWIKYLKEGFFLLVFNFVYFFFEWFVHYGFYLFIYNFELIFKYFGFDFFSSFLFYFFFYLYSFFYYVYVFVFFYFWYLCKYLFIFFCDNVYEMYLSFLYKFTLFFKYRIYRIYFFCDLVMLFQQYLYYIYLFVIYCFCYFFKFFFYVFFFPVLSIFDLKEVIYYFEVIKIYNMLTYYILNPMFAISEKFFVFFGGQMLHRHGGYTTSGMIAHETHLPVSIHFYPSVVARWDTLVYFLKTIGSREDYNYYFLSQFNIHKFSYKMHLNFFILSYFYACFVLIMVLSLLGFFFKHIRFLLKNKEGLFRSSSYIWNKTNQYIYGKLGDAEMEWIYSFDYAFWFNSYRDTLFRGDVFFEYYGIEDDEEKVDYEKRSKEWKSKDDEKKAFTGQFDRENDDIIGTDWPFFFAYKNVMKMYWKFNKKNMLKFNSKAFIWLLFLNEMYYEKRYKGINDVLANLTAFNFFSGKDIYEKYLCKYSILDEFLKGNEDLKGWIIKKQYNSDTFRSMRDDEFGLIYDNLYKYGSKKSKMKARYDYSSWLYYFVFFFLYENIDDPRFIKQYSKNFWFWKYMRRIETLLREKAKYGLDFVEFDFVEPVFYKHFLNLRCIEENGWLVHVADNYATKWNYFAKFNPNSIFANENSKYYYKIVYKIEDYFWWLSQVDNKFFGDRVNFTFFNGTEWPTLLSTKIKLEDLFYLYDAKDNRTTESMKYVPYFKPGIIRGDWESDSDIQERVNNYWKKTMITKGNVNKLGYFVTPLNMIYPQFLSFYLPVLIITVILFNLFFDQTQAATFYCIYSIFNYFVVIFSDFYTNTLRFVTDFNANPNMHVTWDSFPNPIYKGTYMDFMMAILTMLSNTQSIISCVCSYDYHSLVNNDSFLELEKLYYFNKIYLSIDNPFFRKMYFPGNIRSSLALNHYYLMGSYYFNKELEFFGQNGFFAKYDFIIQNISRIYYEKKEFLYNFSLFNSLDSVWERFIGLFSINEDENFSGLPYENRKFIRGKNFLSFCKECFIGFLIVIYIKILDYVFIFFYFLILLFLFFFIDVYIWIVYRFFDGKFKPAYLKYSNKNGVFNKKENKIL